MQAVLGIDVGPLTFGEIAHAYRTRVDYDRTRQSEIMAAIGNAPHYKPKHRPYKPEDFYRPAAKKRKPRLTVAKLRAMRSMFR